MLMFLLLVLVAVTQAENQKCYNFCKLLSSGRTDVLWEDGCNCFSEIQHRAEAFKPWSEIGPVVRLDDTGIYYEPAEIYPLSQLTYIDRPFNIINPAMKINIKSSAASKENQSSKKRTAKFTSLPYNNQHQISTKSYKRQETITDPIIHSEIPEIPTYLDVDLRKATNPWRNASGRGTEVSPLTEEVLINCMDLYIFVHARNTTNYSKLQEIWDAKKFQKYYALTDSQLKSKIQEQCSLPANIVEQSRKEIIEMWPKKNINESKSKENIFSKLHDDSEGFKSNVIKYKVASESATIFSKTFDENAATTISDNSAETSNHFFIQNAKTQSDESETTPNIFDTNKFLFKNNNDDDEKRIKSTPSTIATEQTDHLQDDIKTTSSYVSDGDMATQSDFPVKISDLNRSQSTITPTTLHFNNFTVGSVDKDEIKILSNKSNSIETEITEALPTDNSVENEKFTNPYSKTTPFNENKVTQKSLSNILEITNTYTESAPKYDNKVGFPGSTDTVLTTDYISPDNNIGATTIINDTDEPQNLSENDTVLPKIITIEYSNDTVSSGINGTEETTDNHLQDDAVKFKKNIDGVTMEILDASANNTSVVPNLNNDKFEENVTGLGEAADITGKLYLNYHQQNIPARFIQNPNGQINISIDGISLCDKINSLDSKSKLISVICKCLQSNNCMSR